MKIKGNFSSNFWRKWGVFCFYFLTFFLYFSPLVAIGSFFVPKNPYEDFISSIRRASIDPKDFWNNYYSKYLLLKETEKIKSVDEGKDIGQIALKNKERDLKADLKLKKISYQKEYGNSWKQKFYGEYLKDYHASEDEYVYKNKLDYANEIFNNIFLKGSYHRFESYESVEILGIAKEIQEYVKDSKNVRNFSAFDNGNDKKILIFVNHINGSKLTSGDRWYVSNNHYQVLFEVLKNYLSNDKKNLVDLILKNNEYLENNTLFHRLTEEKHIPINKRFDWANDNNFVLSQKKIKGVLTENQIKMLKVFFSLKKPLYLKHLFFKFDGKKTDLKNGFSAENFSWKTIHRLWNVIFDIRTGESNKKLLTSKGPYSENFDELIFYHQSDKELNDRAKNAEYIKTGDSDSSSGDLGLLKIDSPEDKFNFFFKTIVYQFANYLLSADYPGVSNYFEEKTNFNNFFLDFAKNNWTKDWNETNNGETIRGYLDNFLKKINYDDQNVIKIKFIKIINNKPILIFIDEKGLHFIELQFPYNNSIDGKIDRTINHTDLSAFGEDHDVTTNNKKRFYLRSILEVKKDNKSILSEDKRFLDWQNNRNFDGGFGDKSIWAWYLSYLVNIEQFYLYREDNNQYDRGIFTPFSLLDKELANFVTEGDFSLTKAFYFLFGKTSDEHIKSVSDYDEINKFFHNFSGDRYLNKKIKAFLKEWILQIVQKLPGLFNNIKDELNGSRFNQKFLEQDGYKVIKERLSKLIKKESPNTRYFLSFLDKVNIAKVEEFNFAENKIKLFDSKLEIESNANGDLLELEFD